MRLVIPVLSKAKRSRLVPMKKRTSDGRVITYWVSPEDGSGAQASLFAADEVAEVKQPKSLDHKPGASSHKREPERQADMFGGGAQKGKPVPWKYTEHEYAIRKRTKGVPLESMNDKGLRTVAQRVAVYGEKVPPRQDRKALMGFILERTRPVRGPFATRHMEHVRAAIAKGEPVPEDVRREYEANTQRFISDMPSQEYSELYHFGKPLDSMSDAELDAIRPMFAYMDHAGQMVYPPEDPQEYRAHARGWIDDTVQMNRAMSNMQLETHGRGAIVTAHARKVRDALRAGVPVPDHVLDEYPILRELYDVPVPEMGRDGMKGAS